jgi:heme-degrading monooxygenase HmoA
VGEVYTTGSWKPNAGSEHAFVEAWIRFADWASSRPGAGTLRLARDLRDPGQFVSFGVWESIEAVRGWKGSPEFRERMARLQEHVAEFQPGELELVASAEAGATSRHATSGAA